MNPPGVLTLIGKVVVTALVSISVKVDARIWDPLPFVDTSTRVHPWVPVLGTPGGIPCRSTTPPIRCALGTLVGVGVASTVEVGVAVGVKVSVGVSVAVGASVAVGVGVAAARTSTLVADTEFNGIR